MHDNISREHLADKLGQLSDENRKRVEDSSHWAAGDPKPLIDLFLLIEQKIDLPFSNIEAVAVSIPAAFFREFRPQLVELLHCSVTELKKLRKDFRETAAREVAQAIPKEQTNGQDSTKESKSKKSQSDLLVELVQNAGVELFHDKSGECYTTFTVNDHEETSGVKQQLFREWLCHEFYQQSGKTPGGQALQDALNVVEGQARFDGDEIPVYTRLAGIENAIYLDLCNPDWQAVEITDRGWQVIDDLPVRFIRHRGLRPLPVPVRDGNIDDLKAFTNIASDDWELYLGFLVQAMRPTGPYPVLNILGAQGTGKSLTSRYTKELIDPNIASLRSQPREIRDLMISANNGWALVYDNLSQVSDWLSDAFCRMSTGGGFGARKYYTDNEETIFEVERPVVLNGIAELATRPDLLDRSIIINLQRIEEKDRKTERELEADFAEKHPGILGALLDVVSGALSEVESVNLAELSRMADFQEWVTAAEPALGWEAGTFTAAYTGNRSAANELALEASPVAGAIIGLVETIGFSSCSYSPTDLLQRLEEIVGEKVVKTKTWPKDAGALTKAIRRLITNFLEIGIEMKQDRDNKSRVWTISKPNNEQER